MTHTTMENVISVAITTTTRPSALKHEVMAQPFSEINFGNSNMFIYIEFES